MDNSFVRGLRKGFASLSVAAIMAGALQIGVVSAATFTDVKEGDWFYSYVEQLVEDGVINAGTTFRPGDSVNRAEFTKMVVEAAGLDMETTDPGFSDVKSSDWFYGYVATAKANGIISGSNGKFMPGDKLTRSQAAKIVANAFSLAENTTGAPHFSDVKAADWFYAFVETAYNWSVVDGLNGKFMPADNMTRSQAAKVIVNSENPVARNTPPVDCTVTNTCPPTASGALEVSVASNSAAPMSVPNGSAYNKLVTFDFTASSKGAVDVKGLTVTRGGFIGNTCIDGVSIWDGSGMRHGNIVQSISSEGKATVTFATNPITVPAGASVPVTVGINIDSAAACNSGTINIGITAASDVDATSETVDGTFPVVGATHALVSGANSLASIVLDTLPIGGGDSGSETEIDTGATKEFAKFKLTEDASFEDGILTDLNLFVDGTVSSGDLVDFVLKAQDGAVLAQTAAMDSQKYVNFKLATPYVVPKGASRFVSVMAKVADTANNANRTFEFTVRNDYDVLVKGSTTGAYVISAVADAGENFPQPDSAENAWFKVKAGVITASKSSDSPSGFAPIGADDVVLASYDLKAAGEDMEIQKLGIVIKESGSVIDTDEELRGTIRFKINGQTVYSVASEAATDTIYVDDADDLTSLSTYYTIKAGQPAKLTVEGSIQTDVGGQTYIVELDDVYARRVSSNNFDSTIADQSLTANQLTIEASSLSVSGNGAFAPTIIVEGGAQVQIGSFKFQAGNAEDLNISSINITAVVGAGGVAGINNITLKSNGLPLGDTVSNPNASGDTVSTSGFKVLKNSTAIVEVYADITSAANDASTLQTQIGIDDVNFTGMTSNESDTSPSAAVNSPTTAMAIDTAGTLSFSADTTGTPIQQILHALQTDVEVFRFKVSANNAEDITLDKIYFSVTSGEGQVTQLKLFDSAGLPVGEAAEVNNGQVKFTGLNKLYKKGEIKNLSVKASVTDSGVLTMDSKVIVAPTFMEFTGKSSGTKTISSGGVYSSYLAADDEVTVYDISQFEDGDAVRIDANGDGDMLDTAFNAFNETTTYYVCNRDATNSQFELDDTSVACGSIVNITAADTVGTTDGRVSPVGFNSKTMILEDVEPTIAKNANSLSGNQGGTTGQEVAAFNIMADGERDLTFSKLRVKVSGSFSWSATYASGYAPMDLELWRANSDGSAATEIANEGATSNSYALLISGVVEKSDDVTITAGTTTAGMVNGADDAATAENGVITMASTTTAALISVGDIVTIAGVVGNRCIIDKSDTTHVTAAADTDCSGVADTALDSATDTGNITIVYHTLAATDKVQTGSVIEFNLGSSTETITQGSTGIYVVKADTSGIKDPSTQGTSTLSLRINGSKGGTALQAAGSTPAIGDTNGGLTWSYTNKTGTDSSTLVVSDSYPVDSNTLTY